MIERYTLTFDQVYACCGNLRLYAIAIRSKLATQHRVRNHSKLDSTYPTPPHLLSLAFSALSL